MKKALFLLSILSVGSVLWAQQKHALVIGNANYTGISSLNNPLNDANDMEAALKGLGFTVDKVLNGNLDQMENAVLNFKQRLSSSRNSYGFFFYAGHGVQANGDNYLIPVDAAGIQSESHLRQRAVSVQTLLDNVGKADNELNIFVLDACRDNPFSWGNRSGIRGLYVVSAPSGSIVMYAAAAGQAAADGTGRNGLFTGYLLNNLKTAGLSVREMLDKTGEDVLRVSGGQQHPEIFVRFFGTAYLGQRPSPGPNPPPPPVPNPPNPNSGLYDQLVNATGVITITVTQNTELPPKTVIARTSFITLRGDTSGRTVLGNGDSYIEIESGVTLTLENITLRGVTISVNEGGTLVMNNAATITGNNNRGVYVDGTFTMNGGSINYNRGGGIRVEGTFTMNGGSITNNRSFIAAGVSIYEGTFTMNGGSIAYNNSTDFGGGVSIGSGGSFTMKAGRIENNSAGATGGGVNSLGTFYMQGGTIASNRARRNGGGVWASSKSVFRMTGGTIYGSNDGSNANIAGGRGNAVYDYNAFISVHNRTINKYP